MRFSIVIPAMNRQYTLDYTIKTALGCNFDDYEIIVHDGASDPPLTVPDGIKLYRTDENNSMCSDWNAALSKATGEYIIVFGCDDGILPYALHDIDNILKEINNPPMIRWNRCYYTWKDDFFAEMSGQLQVSMNGSSFMLNSRKLIAAIAQLKMDYTFLPMLYTAAMRRDMLDKLMEKTGKLLDGISPDIYSGFALASLVEKVPSIGKPMSINAASRWSTGLSNTALRGDTEIALNFKANNEKEGRFYDERVPDKRPSLRTSIMNEYYQACKNGLMGEDLLNTSVGNIPAFDGNVEYRQADNVYEASLIAAELLKDTQYNLNFKEW